MPTSPDLSYRSNRCNDLPYPPMEQVSVPTCSGTLWSERRTSSSDEASSSSSSSSSSNSDSSVMDGNAKTVFRTPTPKSHDEHHHTRHVRSAGILYASSSPPDTMTSPRNRHSRLRSWTTDGNSATGNAAQNSVPLMVRSPVSVEYHGVDERPPRSTWFLGTVVRVSLLALLYVGLVQSTSSSLSRHQLSFHAAFSNLHGREVPLETMRKEANEATIETKLVHNKQFIPTELNSMSKKQESTVHTRVQHQLRSNRQPQLSMAKSNGQGPLFIPNAQHQRSSLLLSSKYYFTPKTEDSDANYHFQGDDNLNNYYHVFGWCLLVWCLVETLYKEWRHRVRPTNQHNSGTRRVLYYR